MSASEHVLHNVFNQIVADYHPFAEYEGYAEGDDGFIVYYRGSQQQQQMVVDIEGNIIADSTVGTTRTLGVFALVGTVISAWLGSDESQY